MKSNNNNNNDDDDDDDDDDNNNNTAMGSVHARGDTFFNFCFKSAYRKEHLTPRHCQNPTLSFLAVEERNALRRQTGLWSTEAKM
jgi:hypothetical protein